MSQFEDAAARGPKGEGPVGFRVPNVETQEKGRPADEVSPKATGLESQGGQGAETLGKMTQGEGAVPGAVDLNQVVPAGYEGRAQAASSSPRGNLRPESAQAKDISPDAQLQARIPETEAEGESAAGLGKGVGLPPGSTGHESGQTPPN